MRQQGLLVQTKVYAEAERENPRRKDRNKSISKEFILLPLVLHQWAENHSANVLGHHILYAFAHDQMSGRHREKHAEDVFLHVEAAFRIALGKKATTIAKLFPGARMVQTLLARQVYVAKPHSTETEFKRIARVDNFSDDTTSEVLELLEQGKIVVSNEQNEKAMECVSPLWDLKSKKMIIVATQVSRRVRAHRVYLHVVVLDLFRINHAGQA